MSEKEDTYVLELSKDEAQTLRDILRRIAGHHVTSRRRHAREMAIALESLGVKPSGRNDVSGGIEFEDSKGDAS